MLYNVMDEFNNNKKKRLKMILYSLDGQKEKKKIMVWAMNE